MAFSCGDNVGVKSSAGYSGGESWEYIFLSFNITNVGIKRENNDILIWNGNE